MEQLDRRDVLHVPLSTEWTHIRWGVPEAQAEALRVCLAWLAMKLVLIIINAPYPAAHPGCAMPSWLQRSGRRR